MKTRFALITLLCACLLSGCTHVGHLYPVQGPLAAQTPPPIYTARLTARVYSGSISTKLADGQQFSGQFKLKTASAQAKDSSEGVVPPFNLSAEWDMVYGPGFYTAHVLGAALFSRTTLTGKPGSALQMEMTIPVENTNVKDATFIVKGVAKDDKGNVYKVAF